MYSRLHPGAALTATKVLAIVRGTRGDRVGAVLGTLVTAGVRCLEVTLNTPGALDALRQARKELPPDIELGAGTVRTAADAQAAADAGAAFLVAPDTREEVAERARELGLAYYPGALTPTEVARAWDLGATAVKVFPAPGPGYVKELAGPFRDIPLLPTGGIGAGDAPGYLAAGAVAVGVGGALICDALDGGSLDALADRARRLLAAIAR